MYEESFRTPLIMAWRGHIRPGTVCRELVQTIDYAPTLLDAAGVGVPTEMDGVSAATPVRSGKARGWRTSLYYQYSYDYPAVGSVRAHYGIRTDRYQADPLVRSGADGDPDIDFWELYDLRKDPARCIMFTRSADTSLSAGSWRGCWPKNAASWESDSWFACRLIRTSGKSFPDVLASCPVVKYVSMYMLSVVPVAVFM